MTDLIPTPTPIWMAAVVLVVVAVALAWIAWKRSTRTKTKISGPWSGGTVTIISGSGAGQRREVVGFVRGTMILSSPWDPQPDSTSVISVTGIQWFNAK